MAWNSSVGKPRTRLGKFIDKHKITQSQLEKWSGVSKNTLTSMCSDTGYRSSDMSKRRIVEALKKHRYDCSIDLFW